MIGEFRSAVERIADPPAIRCGANGRTDPPFNDDGCMPDAKARAANSVLQGTLDLGCILRGGMSEPWSGAHRPSSLADAHSLRAKCIYPHHLVGCLAFGLDLRGGERTQHGQHRVKVG